MQGCFDKLFCETNMSLRIKGYAKVCASIRFALKVDAAVRINFKDIGGAIFVNTNIAHAKAFLVYRNKKTSAFIEYLQPSH